MPIISKETWGKFTQEEKERIRKEFALLKETEGEDLLHRVTELMVLFPEEALQPQPLTYEDVKRELFPKLRSGVVSIEIPTFSEKEAEKLSAIGALLATAKFLNKNEDGTPWKPDWENLEEKKWYPSLSDSEIKISYVMRDSSSPVYFRTEDLVKQCVKILGEEAIRTVLSSDY